MNAQDALKLTEQAILLRKQHDIESAENEIRKAANFGKRHAVVCLTSNLSVVHDHLVINGYEVVGRKASSLLYMDQLEISW